MTRHEDLDQAIRAVAGSVPRRVGEPPAQELLEQIIRSDRGQEPSAMSNRAPRRRSRLIMATVATTLAAGAAIALGQWQTSPAYASWSPEPTALSAADARSIVDKCVPAQEAGTVRNVIGEKRGKYAYVDVVTSGGSRTCFRDRDGKVQESSIITVLTPVDRLGREGVELYGWGQLGTAEGYVRLMAGRLGSEVSDVDITIRAQDGDTSRTVHATVRDSYFIAWYPEGIDESNTDTTTLTLRLTNGRSVSALSASDIFEHPKLD